MNDGTSSDTPRVRGIILRVAIIKVTWAMIVALSYEPNALAETTNRYRFPNGNEVWVEENRSSGLYSVQFKDVTIGKTYPVWQGSSGNHTHGTKPAIAFGNSFKEPNQSSLGFLKLDLISENSTVVAIKGIRDVALRLDENGNISPFFRWSGKWRGYSEVLLRHRQNKILLSTIPTYQNSATSHEVGWAILAKNLNTGEEKYFQESDAYPLFRKGGALPVIDDFVIDTESGIVTFKSKPIPSQYIEKPHKTYSIDLENLGEGSIKKVRLSLS